MAKFKMQLPFVAREIVFQIEQILDTRYWMPMNLEIPELGETEEGLAGKAKVHFPGATFRLDVVTGVGHYGRWVSVETLTCSIKFDSRQEAEKWIKGLQKFSGPLEWAFDSQSGWEGKLRFVLEGVALDRLKMNASNRRNELPTYEWDDPNHPFSR